jgi:hypothetical protein
MAVFAMQAQGVSSDAKLLPFSMDEPLAEEMRQQLKELIWRGLQGPAALLNDFAEYQTLLHQSAADYVAAWETAGHAREETEQEVERLLQVCAAKGTCISRSQVGTRH